MATLPVFAPVRIRSVPVLECAAEGEQGEVPRSAGGHVAVEEIGERRSDRSLDELVGTWGRAQSGGSKRLCVHEAADPAAAAERSRTRHDASGVGDDPAAADGPFLDLVVVAFDVARKLSSSSRERRSNRRPLA
jgi:hypothetical protein